MGVEFSGHIVAALRAVFAWNFAVDLVHAVWVTKLVPPLLTEGGAR
ncbi:MAG: hypothetical protein ACI8PT_001236, partial [Gammaproteobacteria bacterium]